MTLYIDSSDYNSVTYALTGGRVFKKSYKVDPHKSYETLEKLDEFLKKFKVTTAEIKKIIVNKGPGSFTGIRVGAAHALALGLAWGVPVKFLDIQKYLRAVKVQK